MPLLALVRCSGDPSKPVSPLPCSPFIRGLGAVWRIAHHFLGLEDPAPNHLTLIL